MARAWGVVLARSGWRAALAIRGEKHGMDDELRKDTQIDKLPSKKIRTSIGNGTSRTGGTRSIFLLVVAFLALVFFISSCLHHVEQPAEVCRYLTL